MENAKSSSVGSPVDPSIKLSKEMYPVTEEEKEEMRHKPYDELGSLQFAANMTRSDIAFAVKSTY